MPIYKAPVDDALFLIKDILNIESYNNLPGFEDVTYDLVEAILNESAKLCEEVIQPINHPGDKQGCKRNDDGSVNVPDGYHEAYKAYCEGGWGGLAMEPEYGGQGLPQTIQACVSEFLSSAGIAFSMYPGLTQGAVAAMQVHASDELKQTYLPNMISGKWSGTMNLTEPHCGTDLGMLRTKAVPNGDGSYAISGQKIFISAGEHDLTENIIHLVLARIEGAPEGTKGISLFVVPKFILDDDGNPGTRNGVSCGALEKKMGIHGNATCVLNYEEATGYLVGEENRGLAAMFVMMNEARLNVGMQGLSLSEVARQNAADYARDRIQGRSLSGQKNKQAKADPIIVHPDIRRILMNTKAFNEGARALMLWTALKGDISHRAVDEEDRQKADDLMGLLTPIIKGVFTDRGFDNTVGCQQVFGGHGYIQEAGMEQFVRDARITQIYEGANGIQALDLVGRKLPANGGRAMQAFLGEVNAFTKKYKDDETMSVYTGPLREGVKKLEQATMWLMQNAMKNPDDAGAASTDYMHLMGIVAIGYMWALMAEKANEKLTSGGDHGEEFYKNKLLLARYFMERVMPESATYLACIESGSQTMMEMDAAAF